MNRSVNEGFSGGEKKRNEIFQMAVLEPQAGHPRRDRLGPRHRRPADRGRTASTRCASPDRAMLVITHYQRLLDYIVPDHVHVLPDGRIVRSGGKELALELEEQGYAWPRRAARRRTGPRRWERRHDHGHHRPRVLAAPRARGPTATIPPGSPKPAQAAFEWLAEHGFPTLKDEDWRYTRLGADLGHSVRARRTRSRSPAVVERRSTRWPPTSAARGWSSSTATSPRAFVAGRAARGRHGDATCASVLAEGARAPRAAVLAAVRTRTDHAFTALNTAFAEDGAFIRIPAGTTVDQPIHLVFFSARGGSRLVSSPRSVILAGPGSQATIVESYVGVRRRRRTSPTRSPRSSSRRAPCSSTTRCRTSRDRVPHRVLHVRQGRDSRFTSHSVALGRRARPPRGAVRLRGRRGRGHASTASTWSRATSTSTTTILIEHAAPHCTSRELYKGVLDGHGARRLQRRVVVRPGASDRRQPDQQEPAALRPTPMVDTRPQLEILADDVKCTHGATVGRLDEDAVFYLRSRGIAHQEARGLLTYAFASEMVSAFGWSRCARGWRSWSPHRLATGGEAVETMTAVQTSVSPRVPIAPRTTGNGALASTSSGSARSSRSSGRCPTASRSSTSTARPPARSPRP